MHAETPRKNDSLKNTKSMKTSLSILASLALAVSTSFAGSAKTYQVTGPVLEANDTMIAVQKGNERWEIARDASTKVTGDVKVGAKVTITYTMTAATVDVKESGAKKGAAATDASASPAAVAKKAKK
jgi:ribosomal 50S subunit-recycling heat shock protein